VTLFFRNADVGNTDSIAESDSARICIYDFYSMGAMPSNRWQAMSYETQNKDDRRDFLFSEISVSLIHDITDFPPLREVVLPEALSFLPSAGALSLKACDQIKEDVSPIHADSCFPPKREL
jgi:hypothetical protein